LANIAADGYIFRDIIIENYSFIAKDINKILINTNNTNIL